jgi:formylmethanofuran dehydrogenase subunit E
MKLGSYSFEEFLQVVEGFHGFVAPGVVLGGVMVEAARKRLTPHVLFDAIAETPKCLPDAIQLLTPCSIGNGWLRVHNLGRFALSLYDKYEGSGVRVFVRLEELNAFPEIRAWLLKSTPKDEQDSERLIGEIRAAGEGILGFQEIQVASRVLEKKTREEIAVCSLCNEAYPAQDGGICRACQGEVPYAQEKTGGVERNQPAVEAVPIQAAVGKRILHDMTRIIPHERKGAEFKAGQRLSAGDVCRLQQMGRQRIFIETDTATPGWIHENDAARAFATAMAGPGVNGSAEPSEGKVTLRASRDGLLVLDRDQLEKFNLVPNVMCASRQNHSVVDRGKEVAGTRAIPLYLSAMHFHLAMAVLKDGPVFRVLPMRKAQAGILITGSEVFDGLIEDRFAPIIRNKIENLGGRVIGKRIVPDDRMAIGGGIQELLDLGCDLLVSTAGLSVDPDDVTQLGFLDAGLEDMIYGAPILPGAMTMVGRIGNVQVMGVPACALFFKTTSFDLLLPRLLAGVAVERRDIARMAEGGLCLGCKACTFPKCPFGK